MAIISSFGDIHDSTNGSLFTNENHHLMLSTIRFQRKLHGELTGLTFGYLDGSLSSIISINKDIQWTGLYCWSEAGFHEPYSPD